MKKYLSYFLCFAILISMISFNAFARDDIKNILESVKEKISVPSDLDNFSTSEAERNNKKRYTFIWNNKDLKSSELRVETDDKGNILYYSYYADGFYNDESNPDIRRMDYYTASNNFLNKINPEFFTDPNDHLELDDGNNIYIKNNRARFFYKRYYNDIEVVGNNVSVEVLYKDNKFIVTNAFINWDYNIKIINPASEKEDAENIYLKEFPVELYYYAEDMYDHNNREFSFVYKFVNDSRGYILAETGERTEIYNDDVYLGDKENTGGMGDGIIEEGLSQEELDEIAKLQDLVKKEEVLKNLRELKELGSIPEDKDFSYNIIKNNDRYIIDLYSNKDGASIGVTADGKTGKIISYSRYNYNRSDKKEKYTDSDYNKGKEASENFLKKYYNKEFNETIKNYETKDENFYEGRIRLVNGVRFERDAINIIYDMGSKTISSFNINFSSDVSYLKKPENIKGKEEAIKKIKEIAPLNKKYVKGKDGYNLALQMEYDGPVRLDAKTLNEVRLYEPGKDVTYSDIKGHWAEDIINKMVDQGIVIGKDKFLPDSFINQYDYLRMLRAGIKNLSIDEDEEQLYEYLIREEIIDKSDKNPKANVKREDAFMYLVNFMGYKKIALVNDIFKVNFNDFNDVSYNRVGSVAILQGLKIVTGDNSKIRAKENLTKAEAMTLLYNYFKTM